jgi:hypothetical protein
VKEILKISMIFMGKSVQSISLLSKVNISEEDTISLGDEKKSLQLFTLPE